ncbi:hypothetical protein ACFQS3_02380 [Glycomyces mayteni]|uniref:Uncharacterized protein n=1 Tax=Glycomyces mayteni TaxID=543887 RepID=A0ABW2D179_9ACTN|nr:hypothetical protein GCM10025732_47740 [Glycomyces mayteni]
MKLFKRRKKMLLIGDAVEFQGLTFRVTDFQLAYDGKPRITIKLIGVRK